MKEKTMTRPTKDMTETTIRREQLLALLQGDETMRALVQTIVQEVLEAEMDEALGATKSERTGERRGYRSGYYGRKLTTRVGTLELRVPQDRGGLFRTEVFTRYQRSEKALLLALAEMYVQGVSTRKVRAVTEELCGHGFSASAVSAVTVQLDRRVCLPHPGRALRTGARGRRHPQPRRAGGHRHRLGGAPTSPGSRTSQPREHHRVAGLPRRPQTTRPVRRAPGGDR
jgi:hypothetical protein